MSDTDFYSQYELAPSQAAEWLIEQSSKITVHAVATFGWMSLGSTDEYSDFHIASVRERISRARELLSIIESHVDRAMRAEASVEEAA